MCVKTVFRFSVCAFLFAGLLLWCTDYVPAKSSPANNAVAEFEPALAVRGAACITCHAKVQRGFITDFGYGDRYFFGNPGGGSGLGPFSGHIYGDFYGAEPGKTAWLSAQIAGKIVVPEARFAFDLAADGAKLTKYEKPLRAGSLSGYLQALEEQKPRPAAVIEKKRVFIGAPTATTLEARFSVAPGAGVNFKYIKNSGASPGIKGISLSAGKDYYTNTGEIVCDGDLFIRGTLFLDRSTVSTRTGCRIYATGPIFLQKGVSYRNSGGSEDQTNLQLVSAEAILLGVGDKSCSKTDRESPLSRRLVSGYAVSTFVTREAAGKSISAQEFGKKIYAQGKLIPSLEDAVCHDENIGFSRLLLDAPQVHIRYKGKFTGLIIAELAISRFGISSFEFDPIFRKVPILPLLKTSDYLEVE